MHTRLKFTLLDSHIKTEMSVKKKQEYRSVNQLIGHFVSVDSWQKDKGTIFVIFQISIITLKID